MISCAHARQVMSGGPDGSPPWCELMLGWRRPSARSNADEAARPTADEEGTAAAAAAVKQWCSATSRVQHTSDVSWGRRARYT